MKIEKPLPTSGRLTNTFKIQDLMDKGSGMVLLVEIETRDEDGELIMTNQNSVFIRGSGGFNGPRSSPHITPVSKQPARSPDKVASTKTNSISTADPSPTHLITSQVRPSLIRFAALGGFETPILHGLCSYAIAVRHVIDSFCGGDPALVREVKARFSSPVLPGQTLQTNMWQEDDRIVFTCEVKETGKQCLTGGWIKADINNSNNRVNSKL